MDRVIQPKEVVRMSAIETPVAGIEGAFKRDFLLIGKPAIVKTGETLFVQTRKPYPAHVTVLEILPAIPSGIKGDTSGCVAAKFSFVPRDTTKRVAGAVRETQGERIDKLSSDVSNLMAQNAELLALLTKSLGLEK